MALIVNLGIQGITSGNKYFEPGRNVEVSEQVAKYLCGKFGRKKDAVYFQTALNAFQHQATQDPPEVAETATPPQGVVSKDKGKGKPGKK